MLEWLERLWERSSTDDPGFILGYGLSFKNETLGLRYQGFPFEVVAEMREDGQDPSSLANHIYTEIKVAEVFQDAPVLEFHGGSHAEGVMELLDSLVAGDLTTDRSLLEGDPAILTGAHDGLRFRCWLKSSLDASQQFGSSSKTAPVSTRPATSRCHLCTGRLHAVIRRLPESYSVQGRTAKF